MDDGVDIPNEQARVPEELTTLHEETRKIIFGLLGEGLYLGESPEASSPAWIYP